MTAPTILNLCIIIESIISALVHVVYQGNQYPICLERQGSDSEPITFPTCLLTGPSTAGHTISNIIASPTYFLCFQGCIATTVSIFDETEEVRQAEQQLIAIATPPTSCQTFLFLN